MSETDSARKADLGPFFGRFSLNYIKSSFIDWPILELHGPKHFQCPFPIHNTWRRRHGSAGRGAAPPEAGLRRRGGGHFSTTAAPRTAVRGILDSPGGGASAMPMGVSGEALLGVIPILECERAEIGRRRPMRATRR